MTSVLVLKPGRERSVIQRHPWIFSGAVERVEGDAGIGETLSVMGHDGQWLAWAAYSPASQIRARIWSWNPDERIDAGFFRERLRRAFALRDTTFLPGEADAYRLVYAESDGLPGLIVDRYGDTLVTQFLSAGAERWKETIIDCLLELVNAPHIYERSDVDVRRLEGLPERTGILRGGPPPERLIIHENDLKFAVDVLHGHKTGFYLDQRPNRAVVARFSQDKEILNCFAYTGGFAIHALAGGARSVVSVDTSPKALEMARENLALNNLPAERAEWVESDVFHLLRAYRDRGREFDMIILDPPKFAPTAAQAQRAARGYKDINLLAFKLLRPGGLLFTFSCSGGVSADLFQKIVAGAALDAGVHARILMRLTQGPDHPVALNFPEGEYLKGLVCAVE